MTKQQVKGQGKLIVICDQTMKNNHVKSNFCFLVCFLCDMPNQYKRVSFNIKTWCVNASEMQFIRTKFYFKCGVGLWGLYNFPETYCRCLMLTAIELFL